MLSNILLMLSSPVVIVCLSVYISNLWVFVKNYLIEWLPALLSEV